MNLLWPLPSSPPATAAPMGHTEEDGCLPLSSRPRRDSEPDPAMGPCMEICSSDDRSDAGTAHPEPFGQPVSDTVLKDVLWTLHSSLQSYMQACFCKYTTEIQDLGDRVSHLEDGMSAYIMSFNTMVYNVADLEDF